MELETVRLEFEDRRALITLNRPESRNALNLQMCSDLYKALNQCSLNDSLRVIIITGEGKAFSSGGDVRAMRSAENKEKFFLELSRAINKFCLEIRAMDKPVIAKINGHIVGAGLGLALACDIRIAQNEARFNFGYINIGLAPGVGTHFVTRIMPYPKACELIFTGRTFTAVEAEQVGIINRAVPSNELERAVEDMARKLESMPPLAIALTKRLLNESYNNDLVAQMEYEAKAIATTGETDYFEEGSTAFIEKRPARFTGR